MDGEEYDLDKVIEAEVKKKTTPATMPEVQPMQPAAVRELSPFESLFQGANAEALLDKFFSGARGLIQDYSGLMQQAVQNQQQLPANTTNTQSQAGCISSGTGDIYDTIIQSLPLIRDRFGDLTLSQVHALLINGIKGIEQAHAYLGDQKLSQVEALMKQHPLITRQVLNSKLSQMQQPQQQAAPPQQQLKLDGEAA